jgi:hypothetical protein
MIAKREAEETLVPDEIGDATIEDEVRTPKRRRIVIRIDDDEEEDEEFKAKESVQRPQPPIGLFSDEKKPPLITKGSTHKHDDHDDLAMQIESEVSIMEPDGGRVVIQLEQESVKAEQSVEQSQQLPIVPAMGETKLDSKPNAAIGDIHATGSDVKNGAEDIEAQLRPFMVEPGIFRTQPIVERDPETGAILATIPIPKKRRFDCLFCRMHGVVEGRRKLEKAIEHRSTCQYNPDLGEYTPPKTNKIAQPARPGRQPWKVTDRTIYWIKLGKEKWACRLCRENGEPEKFWTARGWVRRHWMSCAHNPSIGFHVPIVHPKRKKQKKRKVVPLESHNANVLGRRRRTICEQWIKAKQKGVKTRKIKGISVSKEWP